MKRVPRVLSLVLLLGIGLALAAGAARYRQVRYRVTLLPAPGTVDCAPNGLNAGGTVVVTSDTRPGGGASSHAAFGYVCRDGGATLLEPGEDAAVQAVNARGDVAGWLGPRNAYPRRAALWRDDQRILLSPTALYSEAHALNDSGAVVGSVSVGRSYDNAKSHAALWRDGRLTDLGLWPGVEPYNSFANDINAGGVIVGCDCGLGYTVQEIFNLFVPSFARAGVWAGGRFTPLPKRSRFNENNALAINDRGQVVGYEAEQRTYGKLIAMLWDRGTATPLPIPRGDESVALDINNAGQVVGSATLEPTTAILWHLWRSPRRMLHQKYETPSAVLWENGRAHDLNSLIPPLSGWHLGRALAVNDRGQIAGTGEFRGEIRAFLLTPVRSEGRPVRTR